MKDPPQLQMGNNQTQYKRKTMYPEVILDRTITFRKHFAEVLDLIFQRDFSTCSPDVIPHRNSLHIE